jgi:Protein of unknown function (DUF3253)
LNDAQLRAAIIAAVEKRGAMKSICPSEIARAGWPDDWREHMQDVRTCAYAMQEDGLIDITQGGAIVNGRTSRGAIRITAKNEA